MANNEGVWQYVVSRAIYAVVYIVASAVVAVPLPLALTCRGPTFLSREARASLAPLVPTPLYKVQLVQWLFFDETIHLSMHSLVKKAHNVIISGILIHR